MNRLRIAGIALLVVGVAGALYRQGCSGQDEAADRSGAVPGRPPSRVAALGFVSGFDAAVNEQRWSDVRAAFEPNRQPVFWASLGRHLDDLQRMKRLVAHSTLLDYFVRGDAGIAIVETAMESEFGPRSLVTYTVLAERDRTVRGLFAVEAHPFASAMGVGKTGVFACAACNYRLSFGADWLAVPRCPTRSQCMEALWLVSLTHDLHLDVAVHLGETAVSAETALRNCLESPRGKRQVTLAKPPRFTAWQPSAAHLPAGASSQRCTTECRGGLVAEMNMIAIGRLRYLVVVRGPAAAIRNRRGDIDAILDSFRVLDPGITPDELAELATHGHSGKGVITDNLYRNPRAGLELRGPAGWRPRISAGACMFAIGFTNPQRPGSYLAAEAQGPVGGPWSEIRVGGIIQRRIELAKAAGQKLQVGEWQSRGDLRVIELGVGDGGYGQYAFRPDVLLIINGHACDERDAATLRAAMTSVRSLKRD